MLTGAQTVLLISSPAGLYCKWKYIGSTEPGVICVGYPCLVFVILGGSVFGTKLCDSGGSVFGIKVMLCNPLFRTD